MEKIAIMTDVNAGTDYLDEQYDITVLRSMINFGDEHYVDGIDIKADEFFDRLQKTDVIPSTSAPTVGETMNHVERLIDEGYTDIIMFAISFKLSCIGTMVQSVADEYEDKIRIHVVDTKRSVFEQAYFAINAYKMAQEGKSVKEILERSDFLINHSRELFIVDDLKYLVKNGRLSGFSGFMGSLLQIKPILELNDDGAIVVRQKERTLKRGLSELHEIVANEIKDGKKVYLTVYHTCRYEDAKELEKQYLNDFSNIVKSHVISITPAVGAHIGCGVLGFGYIILE